jgi:nicotinamidase-related amidase
MQTPDFYHPAQLTQLYLERAALVADAADAARAHLASASQDHLRIAAFGIDCQVGFCLPGASLFVPGAVEDMERTISWFYNNIERITSLYLSLDTHAAFQIFHPAWWRDPHGRSPSPLTVITAQDQREGRWTPIANPSECLEYCEQLEATGRYVLTIWPYHTLLGGASHALVPALMEAALFHAIARTSPTQLITKGEHPLTESYSVLAPEVRALGGHAVGRFRQELFDALLSHDRVYVFGQASSHCVLSTLRDLRDHIRATDPALMDRIWILQDAMSPVPAPPLDPLPDALNFPKIAAAALAEFAADGMRLAFTSDPIAL